MKVRRWAFLVTAVLGLAIAVISIYVADGWLGLLPYLGASLYIVGTAGGLVSFGAIGSIVKLTSGAPNRKMAIHEECTALRHRMEEVASPICGKKHRTSRAIAEACYVVARDWPHSVDD